MGKGENDSFPTAGKCDPRDLPPGVIPKYLLKTKAGNFRCLNEEPRALSYLWYMSGLHLCTMEELEKEMRVPGRRWYASDKLTYALQQKTKASTTEGEPWACLVNIQDRSKYWIGRRHVENKSEPVTIVVTLEEVYLKSTFHQKRLFQLLVAQCQRVLNNPLVCRSGSSMIEVRGKIPTKEELDLLSLVPGVSRVYEGVYNDRNGDPRSKVCLREGSGGMPTTPENKVLVLMSGGIDSPVAAYRMMTRGCNVRGIHFLNSTSDTASIVAKNRRLCEILSRIQGQFEMHYVDILKLQTQIVANVRNQNRTLIYKWCMLALSACFDDALLLVTGDSAAQVASQTLQNLGTLYGSISKGIASPLIGTPKSQIVKEARRIGTYEASIQEGADCCQYMMCKTGANLNMGRRALQACLQKITFTGLPVTRESFKNGKWVGTKEFLFTPRIADSYIMGSPSNRALRLAHKDPSISYISPDDEEKPIYFDAAAGTMMTEEVRRSMLMAPEANPNSMHLSGREARAAIEKVRSDLAQHLGVPARDIIFTSGGTESNNIALHGYRVEREAWAHPSTVGHDAARLPADAPLCRVVDVVNHETGSINTDFRRSGNGGRLHLDAAQALTKIDFSSLDLSQVDSIAVTAHKINGPVGVGALYLRNLQGNPLFTGGQQEKGIRPGTENVAAIVGFGEALRIDRSGSVHKEVEVLMVGELAALGLTINRRGETSGYIVHATLPEGYDNTQFVSLLSTKYKVEIGTGSACKTGQLNTSVYDTLNIPAAPNRSIRLSWDSFVTVSDAEKVLESIKEALKDLKPQNASASQK